MKLNAILTSLIVEVDLKALYEVLTLPLSRRLTSVDPESPGLALDKAADPLGHDDVGEDDVGVLGVRRGALVLDLPTLQLPPVQASDALLWVLNDYSWGPV